MKRSLLLTLLLVVAAPFATAKVELRTFPNRVEIPGGTGAAAWKLVYGSDSGFANPLLIEVSPERAYFAQGGWIRLLDTQHGLVLGRWHVGSRIVAIRRTAGPQVDVDVVQQVRQFGDSPRSFKTTVGVGPGALALTPTLEFMWRSIGVTEASLGIPQFNFTLFPKIAPDKARELLPLAEDMARRDAFSPWLRVTYAHLLARAGDPRAPAALAAVLQSEGGDFSEWLPIAAALFGRDHPGLARVAYDRGYKDFLKAGYDPRLLYSLWRVNLFSPHWLAQGALEEPPDVIEKAYRLGPYPDFGWIGWQKYADSLQQQGKTQEAQLWRARAREARQNAPALRESFGTSFDRLLLIPLVMAPALLIFIVVVNRRYRAQHRADMEAGRRQYTIPGLSHLTYWTLAPRFALFLMALTGWAAMGIAGMYASAFMRVEFAPPSLASGSLGGPIPRWYLQQLPASPERDLLLALSYQQSGDSRRAEDVYRKLPQFAESWNNLGVVLKRRGQGEEARAAFQRALQLDPQLHEAAFNLDGATPDLWTELHQQYVPDRPMLATPRPAHIQAAYRGGSSYGLYFWSALRGPFWTEDTYLLTIFMNVPLPGLSAPRGGAMVVTRLTCEAFGVAVLLFALLRLLMARRRCEVTEKPGPRHWIAEIIFPGTSPAWNVFGGLVLTGWLLCGFALALFLLRGTPLLTTPEQMWYLRWYMRAPEPYMTLLNPSRWWFVLPAILLFAVNFALVWRTRTKLQPAPAAARTELTGTDLHPSNSL
jgi:tetratricopeptide (TPR) repeat protein